jgi:multiple sugar transport system permease protein
VLAAAAVLLPFAWMVSTSLKPAEQVLAYPPEWLPRPIRLANFAEAWSRLPFARYLLNTVVVAGSVTLLEVATSSLAAYAFARLQFRGRDRVFLLYLATLMVPGQVTIVPNFVLLRYLGWLDGYLGLIVPAAFSAFGTFLLRQHFLAIPREVEQAARIDGCGPFGVYLRVVLPLATPGLATLAIIAFVGQWNAFLWPLIVTNSDAMRTVTVGLRFFLDAGNVGYHLLMAAALTALAPTFAIFLPLQRHFTRGLALTGFGGP